MGARDIFNKLYPGMEVHPSADYNYALQFDCDNLKDPESFLLNISQVKRNLIGGPLIKAFTALTNGTSGSLEPMQIAYRKSEAMFVCPTASKVVVVFLVDFADLTDKAVARVFLQEFVEAQRIVRTAPPVIFSKDPLGEISNLQHHATPDAAGYLAFALEQRHVQGENLENSVSLLTGFRSYLHYHIKCSKTYLHMRMRKRVAGWMLVLNRAIPEVESEKKTASGKTFTRR